MSRNKPNPHPNPHPNPQPNHQNYVIAPTKKIAEKTQSQLADDWWKYNFSTPQDDNPILDRTGDFAGVNQSGDVYFIGGVSGSGSAERKIVVPYGKTLFFPVINEANYFNQTPAEASEFLGYISDGLKNNLSDFKVVIDGQEIDKSKASVFLQTTDLNNNPAGFTASKTENSIVAAETDVTGIVQGGYYLGINSLPPGKHTITFQGSFKDVAALGGNTNTQNITYTIEVKPFNKDILGNDNNNTLKGNGGNDNIDAFGGDDTVYGYGGDDIIDGGSGNDKLYGGDGNDIVYGGAGKDRLYGDSGDDVVAGGLGDDKIYGGAGKDRLYGGSGNDEISGDAGNDKIFAGNGNDKIDGGSGDDVIDAVAYSPLVLPFTNFGGIRNSGQNQIDTIKGGAGRDTFVLGMAGDAKAGVTGSQYYVGGGDKDYALIQDFHLGGNGDKIQLYSKDLKPTDYVLGAVATGLPNGVGIYTNDAEHDLVGIVQGQGVSLSSLSLTNNSQFNLVG
jgi:Ca2+-binding RTX toxin-like protein